jgi:subtilisin family serine protease
MKRILSLLGLMIFTLSAVAQNTRLSFQLTKMMQAENQQNKVVSILVKADPNRVKEILPAMGGEIKRSIGNITSALIPVSALKELSLNPDILRIEEGKLQLKTMNDKMLINNRIDMVHQGLSPLPQGYDGKDVVMGVIDTGIDFTHPDFKDSTGNTRVLWVWDHLLPDSTNTPAPFNYGQEFSAADINSGNANTHVDQTAHGTHVAGIAAGNGQTNAIFTGAAPKADIIAVSLDFNLSDDLWLSSVADAVDYIFSKADSLNKSCVINISAGTYFGSHDGKDLQAQYIDNLITAKNGRMVVAAAGNAGNYPLHLEHKPAGDTVFTWFRRYSSQNIFIEFWGDTANMQTMRFALGCDIPGTWENRAQSNFTSIAANNGIFTVDTLFSYNGNKLATVQKFAQIIDNKYSFIFNIIPDSAAFYFSAMTTGNAKVDCWSFDMIASGIPTPLVYPAITKYKSPDFNQTICSSFQCSDKVITVGQYVNRNNYIDVNNNLVTFPTTEGAHAVSSSYGPTRDGRVKPDICSTGEVTLSCLKLSSQAWFLANQPFKLAQGGMHIRDGGTSSAAPAVAGMIALIMQKDSSIGWQDIRNRVLLCSKQDSFTGTNLPDNTWGFGKADAFSAIVGCNALSISETQTDAAIHLYPNPTEDFLTIESPDQKINTISIINLLGETIAIRALNSKQIYVGDLAAGVYIISIDNLSKTKLKFIKQ